MISSHWSDRPAHRLQCVQLILLQCSKTWLPFWTFETPLLISRFDIVRGTVGVGVGFRDRASKVQIRQHSFMILINMHCICCYYILFYTLCKWRQMLSAKKSVHITHAILYCNSISANRHFQNILVNESHSQSSSSSHHRWKLISGLGSGTSHKEPWDNRPETQNRHNDTTNKSCFLIRQTSLIIKRKKN